jgi:hypothetical protein
MRHEPANHALRMERFVKLLEQSARSRELLVRIARGFTAGPLGEFRVEVGCAMLGILVFIGFLSPTSRCILSRGILELWWARIYIVRRQRCGLGSARVRILLNLVVLAKLSLLTLAFFRRVLL